MGIIYFLKIEMVSKSKNKNLEQLLSNKTGQIPEQA